MHARPGAIFRFPPSVLMLIVVTRPQCRYQARLIHYAYLVILACMKYASNSACKELETKKPVFNLQNSTLRKSCEQEHDQVQVHPFGKNTRSRLSKVRQTPTTPTPGTLKFQLLDVFCFRSGSQPTAHHIPESVGNCSLLQTRAQTDIQVRRA